LFFYLSKYGISDVPQAGLSVTAVPAFSFAKDKSMMRGGENQPI